MTSPNATLLLYKENRIFCHKTSKSMSYLTGLKYDIVKQVEMRRSLFFTNQFLEEEKRCHFH